MTDTTRDGVAPSSGAISIGGVFRRSFSVLLPNLVTFVILALLLQVPLLLFNMASGGGMAADPRTAGVSYYAALVLSMLLTYLTMGAVVYGTVAHLNGQKASLGTCLARGLAAVVPVVLVALLITVMAMAGMILLIIPGIIVYVVTVAAVPAAVVERPGIWGSVKRSAELTKGNRWRVFAVLLIFYVVLMAVAWLLGQVGLPVLRPDGSLLSIIVLFVWGGIGTAIASVFGAVLYHDLRVAKEGVSTAQLAAVFD